MPKDRRQSQKIMTRLACIDQLSTASRSYWSAIFSYKGDRGIEDILLVGYNVIDLTDLPLPFTNP